MGQADDIRQYVLERIIKPARAEGRTEITVRAGDIHQQMKLHQAMPAVCSALRTRKFFELAAVPLKARRGPANGSNVFFTYDLNAAPSTRAVKPRTISKKAPPRKAATVTMPSGNRDFSGCLALVSCVKSKLAHRAPARDLYTSALFSGIRHIVEQQKLDWYVLSALHGLIAPDDMIDPYERSLNHMSVADRRDWANGVLKTLLPIAKKYPKVAFFAGANYREFLLEPLRQHGVEVVVPMEGLPLGKQLSWLNQFDSPPGQSSETSRDRLADVKTFYQLLDRLSDRVGGPRLLGEIGNNKDWPERGVYFFFEPLSSEQRPAIRHDWSESAPMASRPAPARRSWGGSSTTMAVVKVETIEARFFEPWWARHCCNVAISPGAHPGVWPGRKAKHHASWELAPRRSRIWKLRSRSP